MKQIFIFTVLMLKFLAALKLTLKDLRLAAWDFSPALTRRTYGAKRFKPSPIMTRSLLRGASLAILIGGFSLLTPFEFSRAQNPDPKPYNPFLYGIRTGESPFGEGGGGLQGGLPLIKECFSTQTGARGGLERTRDVGTCVMFILDKILRVIYTIALFLGIIYLIYAGISYITQPGGAAQTHKQITYGITGVIVAIIAFSVVKAIEISIGGGGQFVVTPPAPGPGPVPAPAPGPAPAGSPRVIITNTTFNPAEGFLVFVAKLDKNGSCQLSGRLFNLTRDTQVSIGATLNTAPQPISADFPDQTQGGDRLTVLFNPSAGCQTPSNISYTVPTGAGGVGGGLPQLTVTNINVKQVGAIYELTFVGQVNKNQCISSYAVFNATQGTEQPIFNQQFTTEARLYSQGLLNNTKQGDRLSITFTSDECRVPTRVSFTVGGAGVAQERPTIIIGRPVLVAQQRFTIQLPKNIEDAIVQFINIALVKKRLYDPPFYLLMSYGATKPPTKAVSCTFRVLVTGARITGFTSQPQLIATSYQLFNQPFGLSLPLEAGRTTSYARTVPISLSNQVIDGVRIQGISLENCNYEGGNITGWNFFASASSQ